MNPFPSFTPVDPKPLTLRGPSTTDYYTHSETEQTTTKRTVITGELARRVRRRLGLAADAEVFVKERHWEGGSDYTRESSTEFQVGCKAADSVVTFHPDGGTESWNPQRQYGESVFARFNHWLNAAHTDARKWVDWADEDSREQGPARGYAKVELRRDGGLFIAAAKHSRDPLDCAYFWGTQGDAGWSWELHTIAAQGHARDGLPDFHARIDTHRLNIVTRTALTTATDRRRALMAATDAVMLGRSTF